SDFAPFAAMNADPDVMEFFPATLTEEHTKEMIKRITGGFTTRGWGLYAVEKKIDGQFIGFCGFAIPAFEAYFTPCIEIGWRLRKEDWGKGYCREAALACLDYGFSILDFAKIVSFTSTLNTRSQHLMKRIGMEKIGEFDHPKIDTAHRLCRHVLYEIK